LNAIQTVNEEHEPPHVIQDSKLNHFPHLMVISELIHASTD